MIITASKSLLPAVARQEWALVVRGNAILASGPKQSILKRYADSKIYHFKNALILPGLVNVHTHLELPALLNAIRGKTFPEWVLNLIKAKRNLNKEHYVSAVRHNINRLIQTGTTTVGEICSHGVSMDILKQIGLRSIVFQEIIAMVSRDCSKFRVQSLIKASASLVRRGISPHSPYTVSKEVLQRIRSVSEQKNLRQCMHIAESKDEIQLLQRKNNGIEKIYKIAGWDIDRAPKSSSSFEYLNRIGFLSPYLLAVHAVQVTDEDIRLIKKSKTSIAHCPRSNKELGVGRMPLKKFLNAGITVGLGTDSLASSPSLSMWDEMRYALKIHKRDGITAQDIFKLATIGGAKALGLDKEIGTLEPGKKADIIAVPLPSKDKGDIYSNLLRETTTPLMTIVNGKILSVAPHVSTSRKKI